MGKAKRAPAHINHSHQNVVLNSTDRISKRTNEALLLVLSLDPTYCERKGLGENLGLVMIQGQICMHAHAIQNTVSVKSSEPVKQVKDIQDETSITFVKSNISASLAVVDARISREC